MGLHFQENQYRGINAHLHSHFQQSGGWREFHKDHMKVLADRLSEALPEEQYSVALMPSLQLAHYDLFTDESGSGLSKLDLSDANLLQRKMIAAGDLSPAKPSAIFPVTNLFLEQHEIDCVVIYRNDEKGSRLVTRIELLSPASKPTGSHHYNYRVARSELLHRRIKLVELDYLHERRTMIFEMPDYTKHEKGAFPYAIYCSELQSVTGEGQTEVYSFYVEEPIPVVAIPLADNEAMPFDFGVVYHEAFRSDKLNGLRHVDYSQQPKGFECYMDVDQERIQTRMELVANLGE